MQSGAAPWKCVAGMPCRVAAGTAGIHCPFNRPSAAVQRLEVEDGLCAALLRVLGKGWPSLQEVSLVGGPLRFAG